MFILAASLFFSFSRNAWLGFMTGVAVTLLLPRRFGIFFIFISIFITVISILPNTRERALYVFKTYGTSERFLLWKTAWRMIAENPILGKGLGTFMDYCSKYTSGAIIRYAHNNYLQIWAETGIGSLLSFLSFVASILYLGIKRFRQTQDILLLGLMGALVGFLVESFFDTQFYSLQLASLFWLLVGIYMAQVNLLVSKSANL
jgi:O-antigen ligase